MYDSDVRLVRTVHIAWPTWLDAAHLVGLDSYDDSNLKIVDVGTGNTRIVPLPPHQYGAAVANGHGAVAVSWARDNDWPDTHYDYAVWDGESVSAARDGFAQSWSSDGTSLALLHQFEPIREPGGWLSVVSWPGLGIEYADAPPFATGEAAFDPSGAYVAFDTFHSGTTGSGAAYVTRIVDLSDGHAVDVGRGDALGGFAYWTTTGEAGVIRSDLSVVEVTSDGTVKKRYAAPESAAVGSQDGSTAIFWGAGGGRPYACVHTLTVDKCIRAPDDVQYAKIAPDGSAIIVLTRRDGIYQAYLRML